MKYSRKRMVNWRRKLMAWRASWPVLKMIWRRKVRRRMRRWRRRDRDSLKSWNNWKLRSKRLLNWTRSTALLKKRTLTTNFRSTFALKNSQSFAAVSKAQQRLLTPASSNWLKEWLDWTLLVRQLSVAIRRYLRITICSWLSWSDRKKRRVVCRS